MSKKRKPSRPSTTPVVTIFEASTGANGAVVRGQVITQDQAEARRKAGQDVVVCGPNLRENRRLAGAIERNANGSAKRCPPHESAGDHALPEAACGTHVL